MREQVDLLIKNGTVLTMDAGRRILADGAVAIRGQRIEAVGASSELAARYGAAKVIDAANKLVMPGFINTHTHVIQILLRGGFSQDKSLYDWLFNVLYPGLAKYSPDQARLGALLYCAEAIRSGVTTIVDNEDQGRSDPIAVAIIETYQQVGIRAVFARMFFDFSPPHLAKLIETVLRSAPSVRHADDLIEPTEVALSHITSLIERFDRSADERIRVWPAPSLPNITSEEGLCGAAEIAGKADGMLTLHLAEAPLDAAMHNMTSTEYLHSIGVLSPRLLAAHCTYCNSRDIRLLRLSGSKVAHNPISNLFMASGFAPVSKMVETGVTVGLGTDDGNASENVNIVQVMKTAALVQRGITLDPGAITAEKLVEMATIDGAHAIDMGESLGSLEPGKRADVILIDLAQPQLRPLHHIPNALVYQAYGSEVDTTIVDGKVLMEGRELSFLPPHAERALYADAQRASESIARAAGLQGFERGWRPAAV